MLYAASYNAINICSACACMDGCIHWWLLSVEPARDAASDTFRVIWSGLHETSPTRIRAHMYILKESRGLTLIDNPCAES